MPDFNLQININQNQDIFEPGSTIRGTVSITSAGGQNEVKSVELALFWRTEGIGTTDEGEATRIVLVDKETVLPSFFTRDFNIPVPAQPYSYQGSLIKIIWMLGLYVKTSWIRTEVLELPITVGPRSALKANATTARPSSDDTTYESEPTDIYYDDNGRPQVNRPLDI